MITVGLIKELKFIHKMLKTKVVFTIKTEKVSANITAEIENGVLTVFYLGYLIWKETLDDAVSMFGVESCDTIARIVLMIDSGDDQWRIYRYLEE